MMFAERPWRRMQQLLKLLKAILHLHPDEPFDKAKGAALQFFGPEKNPTARNVMELVITAELVFMKF